MPAGVEVVQLTLGHDLPVASVHLPRQSKLDEEEAAEEAAAAAAAAEAAAAEAAAAGTPAAAAPGAAAAEGKDKDAHGHHEGKDSKK